MHPIRHLLMLLEANWKTSYEFGYRSWYLPSEKRFIRVNAYGSHVAEVAKNPEAFGLSRDEVAEERPKDRDPAIMDLMCSHGWIRVAGADRNNPNKYMILEGSDIATLLATLKLFYYDQKGELLAASLKVRSLDGGPNLEYALTSPELVKSAVMTKELPAPHQTDANDSLTTP